MKKFKFKKNNQKIKILICTLAILILFIIISFFRLNKSFPKTISLFVSNFDDDKISINLLTSNLDYLINTYSFNKLDIFKDNNKKIYLYNTHNLEIYKDNTTIYEATTLLKNNLSKLGIEVTQEERNNIELLNSGLTHYNISRLYLVEAMKKKMDYYIDIHRDSVKNTTVTIKNKKYAKVLFVLGLDNPNYLKNKEILLKMDEYLNKNYFGISRGIYEKKGENVDGIYNQDLGENVLLIEIGGIENNIEEVNNSTEIIALMLYHMIGEK